jgi:hypothetical protein
LPRVEILIPPICRIVMRKPMRLDRHSPPVREILKWMQQKRITP